MAIAWNNKVADWSPATNTPALPTAPALAAGDYYEATDAGTFLGLAFEDGDFLYAENGSYQRFSNNDAAGARMLQLHAQQQQAVADVNTTVGAMPGVAVQIALMRNTITFRF